MHLEKLNMLQTKVNYFLTCLRRDYVKSSIDLNAEYCLTDEPVSFEEKDNYPFKKIHTGEAWGHNWQCAWFHITGKIPAEWLDKTVCFRINIGGEGLIFSPSGMPLRGVTDSSVFQVTYINEYFPLYDAVVNGSDVEFWVDAGANGYFGMNLNGHPRLDIAEKEGSASATVNALQLCLTDETLRQLSFDWEIALDLLKIYPQNHYRYRQILTILTDAIDLYQGNQDNAEKVRGFLQQKLFSQKACDSALQVTAVGHAHIDTAWLWPIRETIRKCGRTFANQIANIEKFPEYIFGASQPQHYQFVKDHYPALYEKVKQAIAAGRWEVQGGMWVEADCNLISGESMIRQFLNGKNFYMDEFGIDVKNLWLPDVFGYSGLMPQIIKGCGCDFFLTQKISWNQFNKFPHTTFIWRGIDGTDVLTHFPPESDYNATVNPEQLSGAQNNFREAGVLDEFLSLFGIGDGGGGPGEEYIERAMRLKDLEGCPKVTMGKAGDFFDRLKRHADKLEIWQGELYLEKHQGTLTTQAKVKKANRQLEYLLKNVEQIYSALPLENYPQQQLENLWKKLLVNQFHDIIPGSSITRVYKETHQQHSEIFTGCQKLLSAAAEKLFIADDNSMTIFNPLSVTYAGMIELPHSWQGASLNGKTLPGIQKKGQSAEVMVSIPGNSFVTLKKSQQILPEPEKIVDSLILENELIRCEFDQDARITAIWDKETDRQLLAPGTAGNVLSLYYDDPANYDAWDIDIGYEAQKLENARGCRSVKYASEIQQSLEFELTIGNSKIHQQIILRQNKRLDFKTTVQWNENHKMLRTSFAPDIHSTETACDLQYGFIKRQNTGNTSWDMARYEVAAHRYIDISDSRYGVALLNNCKYGHKINGGILDLNLLRSPKYPDFHADIGEHEFTYSLLPHCGTLVNSDVIAQAAMLNQEPLRFTGFDHRQTALPCRIESENVSLEVIKKAEKENCLIIRLVETKGENSPAVLHFNIPVKQLVTTNFIEWGESAVMEVVDHQAQLKLKPFEIKTFKLIV